MNDRDENLMSRILIEVERQDATRRILLSVRYNQLNKINLILLKALLSGCKKRGLFVSVDRPHQYMSYLLNINKVPQENLSFLDLISRFSGESWNCGGDCIDGSNFSPFCINDLVTMLENGGGRGETGAAQVDFGLVDFVMIDNLSAMLTYNELADVAVFIQRYLRLIARYGRIFTAIVIDVQSNPHLYQTIQGLCQKEFLVTDDGELQPLIADAVAADGVKSDNPVVESAIIFSPARNSRDFTFKRPTGALG